MTCTAVRRFQASFSYHHRKEADHDETKICAGAMPGVTKEQIQAAREADLSPICNPMSPVCSNGTAPITGTRSMTAWSM